MTQRFPAIIALALMIGTHASMASYAIAQEVRATEERDGISALQRALAALDRSLSYDQQADELEYEMFDVDDKLREAQRKRSAQLRQMLASAKEAASYENIARGVFKATTGIDPGVISAVSGGVVTTAVGALSGYRTGRKRGRMSLADAITQGRPIEDELSITERDQLAERRRKAVQQQTNTREIPRPPMTGVSA